tara:strand:- start:2947 stop:3153 length:207 start_codon:yes stop_codon:yes gene_type:complete
MKVGDLVARRWPTLDGGLIRLTGIIIEKKPKECGSSPPYEAFVLVKWCESHRIVEKVREREIEVISES